MRQYCRYCANLVYGDSCYCEVKKKCLDYDNCKRVNKCKSFELNPIDALGENPKEYKPRKTKPIQCEQISLKGGTSDVDAPKKGNQNS